ncbi:hypothetical protein [Nitrosomonas oligotropha]|uniref:hypothetical protein n=1 Tax=Nitrosomonas oligotropha TaxID=42354 RepID=UPI00136D9EE6|nr:hypothetical protein [Nitrosomonas oligotropha]MXS82759.1 hypothetical protein [Nitrosomonas oligotropha]
MPLPPPPNWGRDEISKFIDNARINEFATFANMKEDIARLSDIDFSYRKAIEGLNHAEDWFVGLFLLRAHSNFLAACRLCWSGQIPESYAVLRSCLENSLYGLYFTRNQSSRETWLRRHDSTTAKKKVKNEFKITTMLDLAVEVDKAEGEIAKKLYEQTIDYGAHPNELALMQTLQIYESDKQVEFKITYLEGNSIQLKLTLKTVAQVGVNVLSLFRAVYPERFNILGITDGLRHIKKGL